MSRIRVVVVSWNSDAMLPRCLAHLQATTWAGPPLELIVVDNGSTDGTVSNWSARYPGVELRPTGSNRGFGAGANMGLHDLDGVDAVALVNPDAFVEPGWLEPLLGALEEHPSAGAACPKILFDAPDPAGRSVINNVGNVLGPTWEFHDRGYGEIDLGQYDDPQEVWAWCGGAVLLRASYLRDIGTFDERLFLYAEDVDLAWRGRRRGWTYHYEPRSVVRHVHRASSGGERTPLLDVLNRRNRLIVVTRHGGVRGGLIAWGRALSGIMVAALREVAGQAARREQVDLEPIRRRWHAAGDAARMLVGRRPRWSPDDGLIPPPS